MKYINAYYLCDYCGITTEETNSPHISCEYCEEFTGCEACYAEHDLTEHGVDCPIDEVTEEIEWPLQQSETD